MSSNSKNEKAWGTATRLVRGGTMRSGWQETCEALFVTSGYVYDTAEEAEKAFKNEIVRFQYSRFANPTVQMFENRLALLEGAQFCRATATGMAAVFASLACAVKAGDRIVSSRALFSSCNHILTEIMPRFGVEAELIDGTRLDEWKRALSRPAAFTFLESPSNPMLELIDIAAVAELSRQAGAKLIVDNVFATPLLQQPLAMGADVVVYSATKHLDGQGRTLGGAILTNDEAYLQDRLVPFLRHTGPALSPFNAWTLLKGMETLDLRVARHCQNALILASHIEERGDVARVYYPGLPSHAQFELANRQMRAGGSVLSFSLDGGKAAAFRFLNALNLIDISNNLGDAKSLATHPATTTHQRLTPEDRAILGIVDGTVRISVGIEDIADIIADVDQALDTAAST